MRPSLFDPVCDQDKLRQLLPLAERLFELHETGANYANELKMISRLTCRVVGPIDVEAALGSGNSEYFARKLLIDWHNLPTDLTDYEMLEVLEALCSAQGSPASQDYWIRCLEVNTGDDRISDLIFWPNEYFGSDYDGKELTTSEILEISLRKKQARSDA